MYSTGYYPPGFISAVLFVLGSAIGSFLNVVAIRYKPDKFLFGGVHLGGRSHCPYCSKQLKWYELVPVISFILLAGKCGKCRHELSWQYPIGEILTGLIFAIVPSVVGSGSASEVLRSCLWIFIFADLWLISLVDLKWRIIPDESLILLFCLGVARIFLKFGLPVSPGTGDYNPWLNSLLAAAAGLLIFGGLTLITRGRGMGLGDVKMAIVLGWVFGWPAIILIAFLAFVIGGFFGLSLIISKKASMKSAVPFGPFLSLAAFLSFLYGQRILDYYLSFLI